LQLQKNEKNVVRDFDPWVVKVEIYVITLLRNIVTEELLSCVFTALTIFVQEKIL